MSDSVILKFERRNKNMSEPELRLDPAIRLWVFLPIVLITFLVGIIKHYVSVLLSSDKKVDMAKVRDSQALIRSRSLRENAKYLPKSSFLMRRHYFNNDETGVLKTNQARPAAQPNPMTDPSVLVREVEFLPHGSQNKYSSYRMVKVCYIVRLYQPPTTYPGPPGLEPACIQGLLQDRDTKTCCLT